MRCTFRSTAMILCAASFVACDAKSDGDESNDDLDWDEVFEGTTQPDDGSDSDSDGDGDGDGDGDSDSDSDAPDDPGDDPGDDPDTTTSTGWDGDLYDGYFALAIRSTCQIVWTMSGTSTADLTWDVDLRVDPSATTCGEIESTSGVFALGSGSAYFEGNYIGAATYGGGSIYWLTSGYVTGGGGLSYLYYGIASY